MPKSNFVPRRSRLLILALFVAALAAILPRAHADDRDLLRDSLGDPYLFIVLDTSGSMAWSPPCTQAQFNAGDCSLLCPEADCYTPLNGDDASSKLYQAKSALYQVIRQVEGVHFGFATYNQDNLRMVGKHWLYKLHAGQAGIALLSGATYPSAGVQQVFGRTINCASGGDTSGFAADNPADLNDAWEVARTYRCPQMGLDGLSTSASGRFVFLRDPADSRIYRLTYSPKLLQFIGSSSYSVTLKIERCTNATCSLRTTIDTKDYAYDLVSDFNMWDNLVNRNLKQGGYFAQAEARDSPTDNTCSGWDPNTDSTADASSSYNIRFPTVQDPVTAYRPYLDQGDVIPLDWRSDKRTEILQRLAPNLVLGETTPDFRTARYFGTSLFSSILHLNNTNARPIIAFGSTPLGNTMANFRTWYQGWSAIAGAQDPDWACRKKYLLILTDGDQSLDCDLTDSCNQAQQLRDQENVRTYVVGFGLNDTNLNPNNKLNCIAERGGTGAPILPQNQQELITALTDILGDIQEEARSFASAAVPSVQAEADDKIFLSSFTPLNNLSVWDGHLDAYIKPLPLIENTPDESVRCADRGPDEQFACHLWDAADSLLTQAPTQTQVDADNLKLGNAEDQRRVYYPKAKSLSTNATPNARSLFVSPTSSLDKADLWDGLGLTYSAADLAASTSTPATKTATVIKATLVQKTATIDNGDEDPIDITYVLGDIFHANPTFIDRPNDFRAFANNTGSDGTDSSGNNCTGNTAAYRCFARKHQFRRKIITVGSNDGMQHFFDSGVYNGTTKKFSNGTGKELFAMIPRLTLPVVRYLATSHTQAYGVDGTLRVIDVMIDPVHSSSDAVNADDREWRTIGIGGLREGGLRNTKPATRLLLDNGRPFTSGYYMLDLTQPDRLNTDNTPSNQDVVPTCLSNYDAAACGPVAYGTEMWEFTDSINGSPAESGVALDEDQNGEADLGDTWSTPVVGQIRILDSSGNNEIHWVAIFGGGFDPQHASNPLRGNYLYMVDLETGEAIYKQQVDGAVPSTVAAIDRSGDGILDRIYFGTTAGYMYKVDISVPFAKTTVTVKDLTGVNHNFSRIADDSWKPYKIFDTVTSGTRRPIYFPPSALVVSDIDRIALAFGAGNRSDLWNFDGTEGRFYMIVDDEYARGDTSLPKTESNFTTIDSRAATNPGSNFLQAPDVNRARGWIMTLDTDERSVGQAFSVSGVTIFSTFNPQVVSTENGDGEAICARTGDSRLFVVFTTNGDPLQSDTRWRDVGEALVTPPFADRSTSKHGNAPGEGSNGIPTACNNAEQQEVIAALKSLFPRGTKFANYTVNVNFIRSDTELVCPIPIPVGITEKNWKEF